jgi:hypothetical protein
VKACQNVYNFEPWVVSTGIKQAAVEVKAMLAHILSKYSVSTPQTSEEIKMAYEIASMPHPKLKLEFKRRLEKAHDP